MGLAYYTLRIYPKGKYPGRGKEIIVQSPSTLNADGVARALARAHVIAEPHFFYFYLKLKRAEAKLHPGPYFLRDDMSPEEVLHHLARGYGRAYVRVTVPEGYTRFDIADALAFRRVCSRERFIEASVDIRLLKELHIDAPSADGYLFPDTYEFEQDSFAPRVLTQMVKNFRRKTKNILRRSHGLRENELVTLASIVEKEAAIDKERPIIAGLFFNRIESPTFRPKRLQSDPTIAYGCKSYPNLPACMGWDGRSITRAMIDDGANPYNTYRREGLPPGPICNPGLAALRAVMNPTKHNFFYFVAKNNREHVFSETLDQHARAVKTFRR